MQPDLTATSALPPRRGIFSELREIGNDLWEYRDLLLQLTRRDLKVRYKQAVMGFAWAIFMPLLIVLAGCMVRFIMAEVAGRSIDRTAIAGLTIKSLGWSFFVGTIGFAVQSLTGNMNLVAKVYFPREVLPLATTLAHCADTALGALVVGLMLLLLGVRPTPALVWVPLLALLLCLITAGASLLLSCANLFFRDVKYIVQVLLTFGIFFTPVLFEPSMLGPKFSLIAMINPLAPVLEGLRLSVVAGHNLLEPLIEINRHGQAVLAWSPWMLVYSAAWAGLGTLFSAILFHRLEFVFAEYV
jgi:homopolymeric O-antigen transport system permease protein